MTRVVLIHKDPNAQANASITVLPPTGAQLKEAATLTRGLPGDRGMAAAWDSSISLAGQTWGATTDGTPTRAPGVPASESVPAGGKGEFSFELPPASFAILVLPTQ